MNYTALFWMLVGSVIFLTGGFILFGGYIIFIKPIEILSLNLAITGCYIIYASVLIMLPFSWKRMKYSMNDKSYQ